MALVAEHLVRDCSQAVTLDSRMEGPVVFEGFWRPRRPHTRSAAGGFQISQAGGALAVWQLRQQRS